MRGLMVVMLLVSSACSFVDYGGGRTGAGEPIASATGQREPEVSAWETLGQSVERRPIRMRTIGNGSRRVIWVGGIHGDETEGMVATDELPAAFAAVPGLGDEVTLMIVEDINPDGRQARTRRNARGVDLNRNYPAANYEPGEDRGTSPLCEPESRVLHALIQRADPHLVMVAHSWGKKATGPDCFVNFDGPAEHLAQLFSRSSGYAVKPSTDIHGTPGSLGSFVGIDKRIPILTIEYEKGRNPEICWEETRAAILAVIRGSGGPATVR